MPHCSGKKIDALREQVRMLERGGAARGNMPMLSLGHMQADAAAGGGLARGRVHEIVGHAVGELRDSAPFSFTAALVSRLEGGEILWCMRSANRSGGRLYGRGMADLGLDPSRLLLVEARDEDERLRVMEEALSCTGLTAVVTELGPLRVSAAEREQTAYRRLQLAAEKTGVTGFVIRPDTGNGQMSVPVETRWRLSSAPGAGTSDGSVYDWRPRWNLELERSRTGRTGAWTLIWDAQDRAFVEPGVRTEIPGAVIRTGDLAGRVIGAIRAA